MFKVMWLERVKPAELMLFTCVTNWRNANAFLHISWCKLWLPAKTPCISEWCCCWCTLKLNLVGNMTSRVTFCQNLHLDLAVENCAVIWLCLSSFVQRAVSTWICIFYGPEYTSAVFSLERSAYWEFDPYSTLSWSGTTVTFLRCAKTIWVVFPHLSFIAIVSLHLCKVSVQMVVCIIWMHTQITAAVQITGYCNLKPAFT